MDGNVDAVVAGVGSGGTISGLAEFLKQKNPDIQMVAADPEGSVVADAIKKGSYSYDGGTWLVEGIGEDFIPDNLNLELLDDAEVVSDKEAFQTLQILLKEEGILGGSSSGTLVAAAIKWCKKQDSPKRVVTFICDTGNKYLSKAYNKSWLHDNQLLKEDRTGNLTDLISRRADLGEMISVSPTDSLLIAYNRMRASDISQIPVLDQDVLVGILDEEDLLFTVSAEPSAFSSLVSEFMEKDLDVLSMEATEDSLLEILSQGKVAIVFDKKVFLGFVTKVDLINHYRNKINN
jgi:cystathionine beta-synthase